ncbi:TonB-dependent receptor [Roseomonas populi]|uniref:TonB-dependent siderophore receptor n=1 Tax=Roseomonas populi TaxID=3121582 RepID=A0ABT1XC75_9PROT|nr:TonB-dependent siderophore receptor [Roseomonas pecuniae]MCR0985722.1 TonB-dependent siderophore receptor [Roseomonas pecuniae]
MRPIFLPSRPARDTSLAPSFLASGHPPRTTLAIGLGCILLSSTGLTGPVLAQEATVQVPEVSVEGRGAAVRLHQTSQAGSLLGLTPAETPATVDVITQEEMQERGLRDLVEVYNAAPGVRAGNIPGAPAVANIRGLPRTAVGYLLDGARAIDPGLISRTYDSFAFERVEFIKGPASVVNGTGSLAGSINLVTRQPVIGSDFYEGLLGYGSFNSLRTGASFNHSYGNWGALRSAFSYSSSDGYVDDTDSRRISFTTAFTARPTDRLTLDTSVAYFHDNYGTPYQGTTLVPRAFARDPSDIVSTANGFVIDRATRSRNYNVENGVQRSDAFWLRQNARYRLSSEWTLSNEFSYYTSDRRWANSEDYTFNARTSLLDRTSTLITHDQQFVSDRIAASYDGRIGGLRNRFTGGYEFYQTDLTSHRRFGTMASVDPFNPVRGIFPADTAANFPTRQDFDSTARSHSVFAENALNITPSWLVLGGIRHEGIDLDRRVDDLNAGTTTRFNRHFDSLSWRLGTVYEALPNLSLYAQYTRATVPITTLLLSNTANARFDLSSGHAYEVGTKASLLDNRASVTASLYQIEQDDILTRDPSQPALVRQGGSLRSRGVEVDILADVTPQWRVGMNAALQRVEYTELRDSAGRDLSGRRPPNSANFLLNAYTSYRLSDIPLSFGASVRHVGTSYTDDANTIKVEPYTLLDAFVAYEVGGGTLTLRGRNLTNAFYAEWSGFGSQQVYLGAPLSVDLTYSIRF